MIEKFHNKKEKKEQWRSRFQINRKPYYVTADTRKELDAIIDEIRGNERRAKRNLESAELPGPTLRELLDKIKSTLPDGKHKTLCERVFPDFLALLPEGLRVKKLKKTHFQSYIDWRSSQTGFQSRKPIKLDTVYKELYAISGALTKGELYWDELENWEKPLLPVTSEKKRSRQETRRTRIVSLEDELTPLLAELRKPREGKQTTLTEAHRHRLADELEFKFETGLRRKEVARLEKKKYFPHEHALRDVKRWKTNTTTKFFPLTKRAEEIIKNRLAALSGSDTKYIFSIGGEPSESDTRTLRTVCKKLNIPYGRFADDGFVPHDLRHSFATNVIEHTDIETARELMGHSNVRQTGDYLHTNEKKLREAIKKREGLDIRAEIVNLYKDVRRGKIKAREFIEKVKKLPVF